MTAAQPPPLRPPQVVALANELDDLIALIQHGRSTLRDLNFVTVDSSVVFACLGSGFEKLLKLSLGLIALEDGKPWPSRNQMQRGWGHDIVAMESLARSEISRRQHLSNAQPYLATLLATVERNELLPTILQILSRHAKAGRFHNLDTLAEAPTAPSPRQLWEEMETELLKSYPDLLMNLADAAAWAEARRTLNGEIDDAIADWLHLFARSWQHGVLGAHARMWSGQLMIWL